MLILTSPTTKSGHWTIQERAVTNGSVKEIKADIVCNDCKLLPIHEQIKCLHKKPKGNPLKSAEARQQVANGDTYDINTKAREQLGIYDTLRAGYYDKDQIDKFFSDENIIEPKNEPNEYYLTFDPNGGGKNQSAIIIGSFIDSKYVICTVDSKETKDYGDITRFFYDNIKLFHKTIRKTEKRKIICFIESQSNFTGGIFKEYLDKKIQYDNDTDCYNIWFAQDTAKRKHSNYDYGVTINGKRLQDMTARVSQAFISNSFYFHHKWTTCNQFGHAWIKNEFKSQLTRFKHFDMNENSLYRSNGKKIKNDSGKGENNAYNDDISDTLHMLVYWYFEWNHKPFFRDQKMEIEISLGK